MSRIAPSALAALPPDHLGAYRVVRVLSQGDSFLCIAIGGRQVVLKRLEEDCLLGGQLHPSIKERLQRVRELAQKHVATLQSVERVNDAAYLVWEYVDGQSLADYIAAVPRSPGQLSRLAREVILSVESLHGLGIVHGNLHERNVIIDAAAAVHLTHVSPLLYNDPGVDFEAVVTMLQHIIAICGAEQTPLGECIAHADIQKSNLRQLAARLAVLTDATSEAPAVSDDSPEPRIRMRALVGAIAVTVVALIIALILFFSLSQKHSPIQKFEPLDAPVK